MKKIKMFESLRYWGTSLILCTGISFNTWAIDFSSGTGTMEDPFVISTADELNNMRNNLAAHYKLETDIDLSTWIETNSPETGWQPIGTSATPFTGNFDGNGHAIENIWISMDSENVGFFGAVGGNVTIKRLAIIIADGKRITGTSNVGILTGLSTAVEGNKQTQIEEVYVAGNVESKGNLVGAIVGRNNNQNISIVNCYVKGNVFGGTVEAFGDYHLDTKYYNIDALGHELLGSIAARNGKIKCKVELDFKIRSKGDPKTALTYGSFKSGKGSYYIIPFDSISGEFSNQNKHLEFKNVVIETKMGTIKTDAFDIVNGKLHIGEIYLEEPENGQTIKII